MSRLSNNTNTYMFLMAGALLLFLLAIYPSAAQTLLALPVLFVLPGYALTAVLFPRSALGVPARLLLSLGLSMAVIAIGGLLLYWSGLGLQVERPWIVLLTILAIEIMVLALAYYFLDFNIALSRLRPRFDQRQIRLLGLGLFFVPVALLFAYIPAPQQGLSGYTMLWLEPDSEGQAATIGVQSEQFEAETYQLCYEFNDRIHTGPTFELEPGETWQGQFRLPAGPTADSPVTIHLYRLDEPNNVYRHVVWWPVAESGH